MRAAAAAWIVAGLLLPQARGGDTGRARTIHRHFTPRDRDTGRYQYVPFDVAPGTTSLTISYRYDDRDGASAIDLGLFEPGPLDLGTRAFRGYSGGAQRTITVALDSASPGYKQGPVPAGEWHVLLGLYKVAPAGVDVDIDITGTQRAAATSRPAPRSPTERLGPVPGRPAWYSGALHTHTTHSDGSVSPAAVVDLARRAGLDFAAITDHNNTTHTRELRAPSAPLVITGEEVTTPAGHANVWGLHGDDWIDFRVMPAAPGAADAINGLVRTAHAAHALFSINHPVIECGGCSWEQPVPEALDGIEIWNGFAGPQPAAIAMWDRLLLGGRHVTAVGASDWHRAPAPIDAACVRVLADYLAEDSVLDAIRRGRVIVTRNSRDAVPVVTAQCGTHTAAIGDTIRCAQGDQLTIDVTPTGDKARAELVVDGRSASTTPLESPTRFSVPAAAGYVRINVYTPDGAVVAVTNPIYVGH